MRNPIRETEAGAISPATTVIIIGKSIFVSFETSLPLYSMRMLAFFLCGKETDYNGGWIIGTRAMYEYAATIMGARNCDFSLFATTIAVGPSAAPIIAMDAASL